ncbi:MAG: PTS glucose transporter subunit IIA [Candidatus Moeniiplasma glomeromycotorum]|nr:PTS glucose transporter subunit IIA [Candidatus Moeniiplasma glomeromycotorum]
MKFRINWVKLKKFFFWLIGWHRTDLAPPVRCRIHKKNEKSLVGKAYYFCDLKSWKIKSPLRGVISKIYPNYTIQITNQEGLQILIDIQVDRKNPMPLDKIFQCEVKEGQKVSPKTVLFIVYLEEQIISVSVYIPWQPEIIGKVDSFEKGNKRRFVKVHYRNPYSKKLQFRKHGKYNKGWFS